MITYQQIENIADVLYKCKDSKFIGYAYTVFNEDDVKEKIVLLKQLHSKATHICYAYRLGMDKNNFKANDDGEPHGTAGKPILGQIDSFAITNCIVLVVRYYGGTKLGVSGLIDAYKECAKLTLASTKIKQHIVMDYFEIKCAYENVHLIYRIIQRFDATIISQQIEMNSIFIIAVTTEKNNTLIQQLTESQIDFQFLERK